MAGGDSDCSSPILFASGSRLARITFPTRQLQSEYLFMGCSGVPRPTCLHIVELTVHHAAAIDLTDGFDGRQYVWLAGREEPLVVDLVIMALGTSTPPRPRNTPSSRNSRSITGLFYQPPAFFDDADVAGIAPARMWSSADSGWHLST